MGALESRCHTSFYRFDMFLTSLDITRTNQIVAAERRKNKNCFFFKENVILLLSVCL